MNPIVFSRKEGVPKAFYNLRAQLYWEAAEMIKLRQVAVPENDVELHGELCAIKYFRRGGKIYIESKDEIKKPKRLGKSPDRADSFVIGCHILKQMSDGKIVVKAPWETQKPAWARAQEESQVEYAMNADNETDPYSYQFGEEGY